MKRLSWPAWMPELTEEQARALIGGLALVFGSVFATWAWGVYGFLAVILLGQLYLLGSRVTVIERTEETSDLVDQIRGGLEDVKNHLFGLEPPSTGKHGRRAA